MGSWSPWVRKDPEAVCGENCGGPAVEESASWFWSSQTILASGFGGPNQVETCYEAGGPLWPLSCTAQKPLGGRRKCGYPAGVGVGGRASRDGS